MAHSVTKIDTNVHATKRGLPQESEDELHDTRINETTGRGTSVTRSGCDKLLPPFLRQPSAEISKKFEDLEWLQRTRVAEGLLANDPSHRWALDTDPEVKARNRYMNVQAWANSRIRLRVPDGECDFINASPIVLQDSVTGQERRYIATQGPKLGQLAHFWHMVFHETKDVAVIVMLTQTVESGREKCAQYFPIDADHSPMVLPVEEAEPFVNDDEHRKVQDTILGQIALVESQWDEESRSEVRKLELTLGSKTKTVWHYLFAGWADYSKPEGDDREALLQLIRATGDKCTPDNPRVVHCSAGVGRTGTFIALDHLLQELESGALLKTVDSPETDDPIFETVNKMREQRMMMVYNEMQLQFIYEVLRERAQMKVGTRDDSSSETNDDGAEPDERSAKILKVSDASDYRPAVKAELEPVPDQAP